MNYDNMTPADNAHIVAVLKEFEFDNCDSLFWRESIDSPGKMAIYVNCSDLFYWGTADLEEVTPDNIHLLREARQELFEATKDEYPINLDNLFAAKSRGMRPQRPYYKQFDEAEKALFDACGPERDRASEL